MKKIHITGARLQLLLKENVSTWLAPVEWSMRSGELDMYPPLYHIENPCLALGSPRNQSGKNGAVNPILLGYTILNVLGSVVELMIKLIIWLALITFVISNHIIS